MAIINMKPPKDVSDTPIETWVVVYYDPSFIAPDPRDLFTTELWDNKATAESVAKVYQSRGYHAWAVCLRGEGHD